MSYFGVNKRQKAQGRGIVKSDSDSFVVSSPQRLALVTGKCWIQEDDRLMSSHYDKTAATGTRQGQKQGIKSLTKPGRIRQEEDLKTNMNMIVNAFDPCPYPKTERLPTLCSKAHLALLPPLPNSLSSLFL